MLVTAQAANDATATATAWTRTPTATATLTQTITPTGDISATLQAAYFIQTQTALEITLTAMFASTSTPIPTGTPSPVPTRTATPTATLDVLLPAGAWRNNQDEIVHNGDWLLVLIPGFVAAGYVALRLWLNWWIDEEPEEPEGLQWVMVNGKRENIETYTIRARYQAWKDFLLRLWLIMESLDFPGRAKFNEITGATWQHADWAAAFEWYVKLGLAAPPSRAGKGYAISLRGDKARRALIRATIWPLPDDAPPELPDYEIPEAP